MTDETTLHVPSRLRRGARHPQSELGTTETFKDLDPDRPLLWAVYSERYARELIEGTGWNVVTLSRPDVYIQHHFVCAPS